MVLHAGDCRELLPTLADVSVDAVVTDPPYGLRDLPAKLIAAALAEWLAGDRWFVPDGRGFMSRDWDRFVPPPAVWDECWRVMKPGAYLLAFAAPRTADLMGLSIRLAGFEIRDSLHWLYGSGFPKSLDVGKAIDKAAGAERSEVTGTRHRNVKPYDDGAAGWNKNNTTGDHAYTAPATEDAARWDGWGTALKPAHEPVIVARKPLAGNVAANVLEYGTGALNINGCRVGTGEDKGIWPVTARPDERGGMAGPMAAVETDRSVGRWPPNILLTHSAGCEPTELVYEMKPSDGRGPWSNPALADGAAYGHGLNQRRGGVHRGTESLAVWDCAPDCPVAELDRQSGTLRARGNLGESKGGGGMYGHGLTTNGFGAGDTGGASRFYPTFRYEAKAPTAERPRLPDGTAWPTVKPLALMRWLVRLVTPPGGTVLDPFAGTGTTGEACALEGFDFILIENHPKALALARLRLAKPVQGNAGRSAVRPLDGQRAR